jgi:hypothetical protein
MMHRLRLSSERRDKLAASYSRWFTQQKMASLRIRALYALIDKFLDSQAEYESVSAELGKLLPLYEGMLQSVHEISLLERGQILRDNLQILTDLVEELYSAIFRQLLEVRENVAQLERARVLKGRLRDLPTNTEEAKALGGQVEELESDTERRHVSRLEILRRGNEDIGKKADELSQSTKKLLNLVAGRMELWPKRLG